MTSKNRIVEETTNFIQGEVNSTKFAIKISIINNLIALAREGFIIWAFWLIVNSAVNRVEKKVVDVTHNVTRIEQKLETGIRDAKKDIKEKLGVDFE